jgi:ISXO2 transposase-like protein
MDQTILLEHLRSQIVATLDGTSGKGETRARYPCAPEARLRAGAYAPAPVLIVRDRHGATTDAVLPDRQGETIGAHLQPLVAKDAVLVSDGAGAYGTFADENSILHIALITSRGEHLYEGFHIQNVNAYVSRLKDWLRRFKRVATHHLPSYLGCRRMIEREGDHLTATRRLIQALPQPST